MKYPILFLKPKREKSVILRHPWVFSGAFSASPLEIEEGQIVEIQSSDAALLGYGFYSKQSQITCRMFEWRREQFDFESKAYWQEKINTAYDLRKKVIDFSHTDTYRLIHAEGDFMPGIIADVYKDILVLQVLVKGTENLLPIYLDCFQELGFKHIYLKTKNSSKNIEAIGLEQGWIVGGTSPEVIVKENGHLFKVNVEEGQKTGFFIDQRDNRKLVGDFCKDKKVLNTFCYTGGFSVYAANMGAKEIVSVDISKDAVMLTDENVKLNNPKIKHEAVAADCFEYLSEMPENEFDVIILDPPAFAKNAKAIDNAARGYKQINLKAFRKIKKGGILYTFSCSQNIDKELFRKIVFGAAADAHRNVQVIYQMHQPADHPVNIYHPEGEYLKGLVLYVD